MPGASLVSMYLRYTILGVIELGPINICYANLLDALRVRKSQNFTRLFIFSVSVSECENTKDSKYRLRR